MADRVDVDMADVEARYRSGESVRVIASKLGVHPSTVYVKMRACGVVLRPAGAHLAHQPLGAKARIAVDVDEVRRRYAAGESIRTIARALGVSYSTVRNRMGEAEIQRRGRGPGVARVLDGLSLG